jgi:hypothetical protein
LNILLFVFPPTLLRDNSTSGRWGNAKEKSRYIGPNSMKVLTFCALLLSQVTLISQTATTPGFNDELRPNYTKKQEKEAFGRLIKLDQNEHESVSPKETPGLGLLSKLPASGNKASGQQNNSRTQHSIARFGQLRAGIDLPQTTKTVTITPLDSNKEWESLTAAIRLSTPAEAKPIASPLPSPGSKYNHDDDLILLADLARIQPPRPALTRSLHGANFADRITIPDRPTANPTPIEAELSFVDTRKDKFIEVAGAATSATGLQIYKLGQDEKYAGEVVNLLKNLGLDAEVALSAVKVVEEFASSPTGVKVAVGAFVAGAAITVYKFWFGQDGTAKKQAVSVQPVSSASPTPSTSR